ncbi:hypothetical protein [Shewanella dokdonensis]|uniref:Aldose 1-epimerase n=1 Tax=Shewanella dokdonensis TaxID=712036 RepID=A0ABX8DAE8_9GAMM|nr:hypothetical protein [Shewanella dokdonensis]MCL1075707.1 hypothetical protein [Shewanella dokdonensis]QVK21864.1 hypothetical protein KHX94_09950 [Shewanella dokdonensis]
MSKLKSRIKIQHQLSFAGDYSCETVAFFNEHILVLRLWDQQASQPLLQFRRTEDLQLLLSLPLAEYDGSQIFCRWGEGLALLGKTGLWFWPSIAEQDAEFYPLHNGEVLQQQLNGQQYQFTPLQMLALDEQQLLLRMSGANNRSGRAISWLFVNEDGDSHIVNRFKELDDPEILQLPELAQSLPELAALAVNEHTIWGLCYPAPSGKQPTASANILVPYQYRLPKSLLGSLSKLLGAGQKRELLLQPGLQTLAAGRACFSENHQWLWLQPKGKSSLECYAIGSSVNRHQLSLTPAQNLGDINKRQARLSFWDATQFLVHNSSQLNLCEVLLPVKS